MPEVGHSKPPGSAVVDQHDVQFAALSRSSEVGRVLCERSTLRTARQETQKDTHVFYFRDHLLDSYGGDVERRHGSPYVRVAFIRTNHEGTRLCDCEVAARHAGSCRQESRTGVVAYYLSEIVRVVVVWIGADSASEQLSYIPPGLVYGGENDMARRLSVKLLNSFPQVRFDYGDTARLKERRHAALFLQHRLALDQFLRPVLFEDGIHNRIVFRSIDCPVNVGAAFSGVGLELLQIVVEMGKRMLFDLGPNVAQLLPLGNSCCLHVTPLHRGPEESIMHRFVDLIMNDEQLCRFCRICFCFLSHVLVPPFQNGPPFRT